MKGKLVAFLFVYLFLINPIASAQDEFQESRETLERIQKLLERGNLPQAGRLLNSLDRPSLPLTLQSYWQAIAGNLALAQGDYSRAIVLYEELLSSNLVGTNLAALLNNAAQARLKREQIYLIQEREDKGGRTDWKELAYQDRLQAIKLALWAASLEGIDPRERIPAKLNLAKLGLLNSTEIASLQQEIAAIAPSAEKVELMVQLAPLSSSPETVLNEALNVARQENNPRLLSWVYGDLGKYYESQKNYAAAIEYAYQAQLVATEALDWAHQTQWHWLAARIYQRLDNRERALSNYRLAANSIKRWRESLAGNRVGQNVYIDTIQPLLQDYLSLLLNSSSSEASLTEAIEVLQLNQLSELDRYFGSICQINVQPLRQQVDTARIYTVILPQAAYAIVQFPNGSYKLEKIPLSQEKIEAKILHWQAHLKDPYRVDFKDDAKTFYDLLIRPLEAPLKAQQVRKLIFIQDGIWRGVPMAALYDSTEDKYLIEKFAIAYSLGLSSKASINLPTTSLIAGASEPIPPFSTTLFQVPEEIKTIGTITGGTELLNQAFSADTLSKRLSSSDYQLLHLASHSLFTGFAEEAILQTGAEILSLEEFSELLQSRRSPLSHLTLSACETAAGNRYAVLGLAGVGLRSGISSVLASLWLTQDEFSKNLMVDYYTFWLEQKDITLALQKAQINQIRQGRHPASWSAFILIN